MGDQTLVDLLWIALSASLVFLMQAGFLCLETGLTRSKNNINVAIKNIVDFSLASVVFFVLGFGLMYGVGNRFVGLSHFLPTLDQPFTAAFFVFQLMFCGTAVTIISGAVAERLKIISYLIMTVVIAGFIYPLIGHWAWAGNFAGQTAGWLESLGFYDFAGSTVVHSVGGWASLALILIIGARSGIYSNEGMTRIQGSSIPLAALGVLLLMVGWIGFNGGSELAMTESTLGIIANTIMAGSAGLVSSALYSLVRYKRIRVIFALNGPLAGLVAVTASANIITPVAAMVIGFGGGVAMIFGVHVLDRFKIDDAVGAIPVHLMAGIWGTLAVGIFGDVELIGNGLSRFEQVGVQLIGIGVTAAWVFCGVFSIMWLINRLYKLRISAQAEEIGLNISEHEASTELADFYRVLEEQAATGDLSQRVPVDPFSEAGQIATRYNEVLDKLESTSQRSEAIIANSMDAILTVDKSLMQITLANPSANNIFRTNDQELVGQGINWLMSAQYEGSDEASDLPTAFHKTIASERALQIQGRRANGDLFPLEVSVASAELESRPHYILTMRDITERVEAENTIRETQQRLQTVMRNAPVILYVLNSEGTLMLSEGRTLGDFGFESDSNTGQHFEEAFAQLPPLVKNLREALKGEEQQWQMQVLGRYVDNTAVPLFDDHGLVNGVLGISLDVTDRVIAEDTQKRFIELLAIGAQIAEQISVILDSDDLLTEIVELLKERLDFYHVQIFSMNADGKSMTSVGASGRLGQSLRAYGAHEISLDHPTSINARAARTREIIVLNDVTKEKNFLAHPLLSNTRSELSIPLMAQGNLVGVLDIQDIRIDRFKQAEVYLFSNLAGMIANSLVNAGLFEERKQQAELLAKQEERTRALYALTTLADLTLEQQFATALTTACGILHIECGAITRIEGKQSFIEYRHDPNQILLDMEVQPLKQSYGVAAQRLTDVVAVNDVPNSPLRLLPGFQIMGARAYLGSPIFINGTVHGTVDFLGKESRHAFSESDKNFIRLLTDWITTSLERDIAARQLASARDEAIQASEFKTEMLAKVSHELKTPLGVIIGYAELMHDGRFGPVNDNQRQKSNKIVDSAQYLTGLVGELLDMSRGTAGTLKLEYEQTNPTMLVTEISDELRPLVEGNELRFAVTFDPTTPDSIVTDSGKMRQIITNLVTNSVKFTDNGFIRISARGGVNNTWQLMVEDTGIGIPRDQQDLIFEPFKQVDGTPTKEQGGAGLGLAIVKQIVDLMYGDIKLTSDEGYGSRFEVTIPVDPRKEQTDDNERRNNEAANGQHQITNGAGR